jgi:methyl-accepting chemotaxis protein
VIFQVLYSIQKRMALLIGAVTLLLLLVGGLGAYWLQALQSAAEKAGQPLPAVVDQQLLVLGGATLLAVLVGAWLCHWALRPVQRGVQALAVELSQAQQSGRWSASVPVTSSTAALDELATVGQLLNEFGRAQSQVVAQVTAVMQSLGRGDTSQTISIQAQGDLANLVDSVHAGLAHVQAVMAELHRFIHFVYEESHDIADLNEARARPSETSNHALLGPALQKMLTGHSQLLSTVHDMSQVVEKSSITLADLSWQANTINKEMKALATKGAQIAASSQSLTRNSTQVSADASSVAQLAQLSKENSQLGQVELQTTIEGMRDMGTRTQVVSSSITRLQVSSEKIEHIVQLIRDIADKINLLSLNAAIEAARAGEHGKGFAVVSDEVRKLADKTFAATREIDESVSGIMNETGQAVSSMNELLSDVQSNVGKIEQVGSRLNGILDSSSALSDQMGGIVQASEQSAQDVAKISHYLVEIQDELASFGLRIESQERQTLELTELGEGFYDKLVELNLQTLHSRMFQVARQAADAVQTAFEHAIQKGEISAQDLLSLDHFPIQGTNPTKYSSRFDAFTDRVLPAIQEQVLNQDPTLVFAICTNKRGYVPTHNDKFAKAPTGIYERDLVNSRSKRIFSDRTGSRCGAHTKKVLLQTYKRDTGEIMHDLSVPIYLQGTHWGGFRMGYKAH